VVIGYNPSGMDISRDIAGVAQEVHVAIRSAPCEMPSTTAHANLWLHSMLISSTNIYPILFLSGNMNLLILLQIFIVDRSCRGRWHGGVPRRYSGQSRCHRALHRVSNYTTY
jgi:hypothetical protein